jgi:hypothetical protein
LSTTNFTIFGSDSKSSASEASPVFPGKAMAIFEAIISEQRWAFALPSLTKTHRAAIYSIPSKKKHSVHMDFGSQISGGDIKTGFKFPGI